MIKQIIIADHNDKDDALLAAILGKGERATIALALALHAGLLIDEKLARKVVKKLNLKIIATAGVLLIAITSRDN